MFDFRLQAVLDYRAFLEDRKKMELAEKQRFYIEEKRKSDLLRTRRLQYHEALRTEASKEELSIELLSTYQNYIIVIENQMVIQDERTKKAQAAMAVKQEELKEARKQKEVMVRARERAFEKYKYKEEMKTQKLLDDVSSIKYVRSMRGMDATAQAVRI